MANTTIKITQLPSIGNGLTASTILPVVNTTGTAITAQVVVGTVANFILTEAGNTLEPAFLSTIAYSVANAAQPNITSVGTLSVNTLKITGGNNGYFLQTNGNGNLAWVAGGGSGNGVVGGSNTQIQFNNAGNFGGDPELTWDASNNQLNTVNFAASSATIYGNVNAVNVNATGNLRPNAIYTDNYFYANGYVFGGGGGNGVPGGSNTQVQFNNNGVFAGQGNFTYDAGNNILNVIRANASYLTAYTSIIGGNSVTANFFIGSGANLTNIAGANVGGFVPNANVANTAFAVAVANVIGLGNIATLSLSGSSSNVLYGNGIFAAVPAPTVAQDITSNGAMSIMTYDGNLKYVSYATVEPSSGNIAGGNISATGNITANNLGNISSINIDGSNSNVLYGNGVFAAVAGGANTGNVTFDDVTVQGDNNSLNLSAGSDFTANLAYLQVRAGDVASHIHLDTGNNEAYDLIVGDDQNYVQVSSTGNILLSSYDSNTAQYTWTLDYNGNLILAGGNSVIQSIANSSLDILNPNVSTMVLTPDPGYYSQSLVLDPTAPGHIHLRSPGSNIDQPSANLFLGGEASSFEVGQFNGAVPNLFIHSNNNTWTFDIDGNLTLPQLSTISDESVIGTTLTVGVPPTVIVISGADFSPVNTTYTKTGAATPTWEPAGYNPATDPYIEFSGGEYGIFNPGFVQALYVNSGTLNKPLTQWNINPPLGSVAPTAVYTYGASGPDWVFGADGKLTFPGTPRIDTDANNFEVQAAEAINFEANTVVNIYTDTGNNAFQWQFGDDGNLTLPATTGVIANVSITLEANDTGNITGLNVIGDSHANLYAHGNVKIVSNSSNTNATWTFGADGSLTLPIGVSIDYNGNVQYPKIIADSGKLFSVQGQGNSGSAAMAWSVNPNAASQYAAVSVSRAGGDDLAKVILQAQSDSGNVATAKTWQFSETGNLTLPGGSRIIDTPTGVQISGAGQTAVNRFYTKVSNTLYETVDAGVTYRLIDQGIWSLDVVGQDNPRYTSADLITWADAGGGLPAPTGTIINGSANITVSGNTWTFNSNGNLTLPTGGQIIVSGGIVGGGASPAPYISGFDSIGALEFTNGTSNVTVTANSTSWTFGTDGNLTLPGNTFAVNYANGTQVSLGGGNVTWAQLEDKDGNSGPTLIALGQNAGLDGQGNAAIAIGKNAGQGGQGASSITIGEDAGGNTTQGANAVAIGKSAGFDAQGFGAVAIGSSAGSNTQGGSAVALGDSAGQNSQGVYSVAIGYAAAQINQGASAVAIGLYAGQTNQGNNSIVLNATGAALNQTTANTFTVAPVRNDVANIAEVMLYNTTSKEITYGNTISVAGNVTANNFVGNGNTLSNVATKTSSSWTLASGTNTVSISIPLNGTYAIWINGNIPNGIITYTATAVITNTNVPVLGSQYAWYYAVGNALVLTSIPDQFTGTVGSISNVNTYAGNTANVFTFGITNNSGNTAVVNYGYTKL